MLNEFLGNSWERRMPSHLWAGKNPSITVLKQSAHFLIPAASSKWAHVTRAGPSDHSIVGSAAMFD